MFFVSYQKWEKLIEDPGHEMNNFRNKTPRGEWEIEGSEWRVYLVNSEEYEGRS